TPPKGWPQKSSPQSPPRRKSETDAIVADLQFVSLRGGKPAKTPLYLWSSTASKLKTVYWFFSSARTRASSEIGSASPCPRQVYTFTCLPPSSVYGAPVALSRFKQKMPL